MVVTTAVVARLLELTDALSDAVLANSDDQALHFLSGFGVAVTGATQGFAAVVIGLVVVLAALLLWIELMVRASLVYLLVAISPLGFAATLWPSARGFLPQDDRDPRSPSSSRSSSSASAWPSASPRSAAPDGSSRAARSSSEAGGSVGTLLVGAVLFGLAAFSPFLILKLVPVAEAALVAQGVSRGPFRASQSAMSTYSSTRMVSRLSGPVGRRRGGASPARRSRSPLWRPWRRRHGRGPAAAGGLAGTDVAVPSWQGARRRAGQAAAWSASDAPPVR